jgi:hypothetical protein
MSTKKIKNLSVATGKYTDHSGTEKTNWVNIGGIFQKDDGGKFMLIDRTFNPAGVPNPENKSSIIVGMFDIEEKTENPKPAETNQSGDDIPF